MKSKLLAGVALATVLGIVLPPSAPASDTSSIYDTLALRNDLTVMYVAATEAKEVGTLKQRDQKYTLFAPSDAAFSKRRLHRIPRRVQNERRYRIHLPSH